MIFTSLILMSRLLILMSRLLNHRINHIDDKLLF